MSIIFLRHGKLKLVYPTYQDMPFHILCDLASGAIDPGIDEVATRKALVETLRKVQNTETAKIFTAPSQRARETASIMQQLLQSEKKQKNFIVFICQFL